MREVMMMVVVMMVMMVVMMMVSGRALGEAQTACEGPKTASNGL